MILTVLLLLLLTFLLLIYFSETNPTELCDFFSAITTVWSGDCRLACREVNPDRFFPCHCNECSCVQVEQYMRRWDPDTNLLENEFFCAFYAVVTLFTSTYRFLTFMLEFTEPECRPDLPVQVTTEAPIWADDNIQFEIVDDNKYFDKLVHHSVNKSFVETRDDFKVPRDQIDDLYGTEASSSQKAAAILKNTVSFEGKEPESGERLCPGCENKGLTCIGSCPKATNMSQGAQTVLETKNPDPVKKNLEQTTLEVVAKSISESCKKCKEKGIKCSQGCDRVVKSKQQKHQNQEP